MKNLFDQLTALSGLRWTNAGTELANACQDWRKRYTGDALAVVEPHTTPLLQEVVSLCARLGVAITTQGGNTGLVGGSVPPASGQQTKPHIVLKTGRLREHLRIDSANMTLTASAGYTLHEIQEFADAHGFLFPLSLASEGLCTLGGNLASNAGGVAVLRYGNTRELCLGLEFVDATGNLCGQLQGLRKNNTGYDMRHLLIGSEGTLGIITTACMRLYPAPRSKVCCWIELDNLQTAIDCLGYLQQHAFNELSSFEWMNANALAVVQRQFNLKPPSRLQSKHPRDHVLAEFTGLCTQTQLEQQTETILEGMIETLGSSCEVSIAKNLAEANKFWALRENISEAQAKEGLNVKHDVACPVSQLTKFHDMALHAIEEAGIDVRPILFGHLGDGNLHFNLSAPAGENPAEFLAAHQATLNSLVHDSVLACGGTISAEHGIGQLKAPLLKAVLRPSDYAAMRAIKTALDPNGLFNPGKVLL